MPRHAKPPRLWKRPARRDRDGRVTHPATWIILDGGKQISTGINTEDRTGAAEIALADYINERHNKALASGPREDGAIPIADVLNLYLQQVVISDGKNQQAINRVPRLIKFFGNKTLADVNGQLCREYVAQSSSRSTARNDLADLRSAINLHHKEGLHKSVIKVWVPERNPPRERWLTRSEAALIVREAYRFHYRGNDDNERSRLHVSRFILAGLYTGSRPSVVAQAALRPTPGRPYFDLDRGLFYRKPSGAREASNKRRPPVPIPPGLLGHLRRWKRQGARFLCEYRGQPVKNVEAFSSLIESLGLNNGASRRDRITRHTLRHTCATWLMQGGADLWRAAEFLGMTTATLERVYGHHHPSYLGGVHKAFRRGRLNPAA